MNIIRMEKELIMLVGPMGSGKSTLCKNEYSSYFRISQDEQGKKEHFNIYLKAINEGKPKIIIDRVNHVYSQRKKYIELAKEKGYKTKIIVNSLPFKNCFKRIIKRENHPNLSEKSAEEVLLRALRSYFKEYQRPTKFEADKVIFLSDYDPYILDLSKSNFEKVFVIGDVHGCANELEELLNLVKKKVNNKTAIVFVGDLFDKGPKIKEVWNLYKTLPNTYTVLGNHEEKLKKYLRGNNISINHGLDKTIEQLNLENIENKFAKELLFELESLPYMIKLSEKDYIVHAGLNPLRTIETQSKESLLFTRTFNPKTLDFTNSINDDFWFENYDINKENIHFGHHYHEKIQVKKNVFSLDGYCVYGKELRGILLTKKKASFQREFFRVRAKKKYFNEEVFKEKSEISHYEKLVKEGYLKKVENEDLVLFNYTDKCTFEKKWTKYTLQARGIIFDKKTKKIVARPFVKFFNLGENEGSMLKNLPLNLKYSSFEKVDGSLGIIYFYNKKWNVATRGSFTSKQAIEAEKMLKDYSLKELNPEFTYLVEIIYPENKIIVDYKGERRLVLLGCIHTNSSEEMSEQYLEKVSKITGFSITKKFDYNIEKMIELQKALSKDKEGFVVKFENNLRVKIKSDQYLKLSKIIANISPLSLWEVMEKGKVSINYLQQIPEEILPEVNIIKDKLEKQYTTIKIKIYKDLEKLPFSLELEVTEDLKKKLALHLKVGGKKYDYSQIFFPIYLKKVKVIDRYIMSRIRPNANQLKNI